MINEKLINPASIVVIGGSDDLFKPGGKVLKNIIDGKFAGKLYVVNPKQDLVIFQRDRAVIKARLNSGY